MQCSTSNKPKRIQATLVPPGPAGTYTNWKGTTSDPVKVGANQVEGQLLCYSANGITPNLIKHLVRNFTGIETLNANSTNVNPPRTIKQSGIPIVPNRTPLGSPLVQ